MLLVSYSLDIALACIPRVTLFLICRKFLLRTLYHDLKDITIPHPNDRLPPPSGQKSAFTIGGQRTLELHARIAQPLFSFVFSEVGMLFLVLIAQGMHISSSTSRMANWTFSLGALISFILLLIPMSLSFILTMPPSKTSLKEAQKSLIPRLIFSFIPLLVYLYFLSRIPLPVALSSSSSTTTMSAALARLVVLGTVILAGLSGFGACSKVYELIPTSQTAVSEGDLTTAERTLSQVRADIAERKAHIEAHKASSAVEPSSWYTRVLPSLQPSTGIAAVSQELQGLVFLEQEMASQVNLLQSRRERDVWSLTWKGRAGGLFAKAFGVYCLIRILSSILNVMKATPVADPSSARTITTAYPDLITHLLAFLFARVSFSSSIGVEEISAISRQISLLFVGIIILSSVRVVLAGVTRALRVTSRNLGASLMLLLLAQLMGIYLLTTLVQLRSFSPTSSSDDEDVFSTLPQFETFGNIFDWTFLAAVAACGIGRWMRERVGLGGRD